MTKEQYRRANQTVFVVMALILAYLLVVTVLTANNVGFNFRAVVRIVVGILCFAIAIFAFIAKRETRQGALLLSYSAIAAYAVFVAVGNNASVYAYVFPIIFAAMSYFDYKLIAALSIIAIAANLLRSFVLDFSQERLGDDILSLLVLLLMTISATVVSKLLLTFNKENTQTIQEAATVQEENSRKLVGVAENIVGYFSEAMKSLEQLQDSIDANNFAMSNIAESCDSTAQAIQRQAEMCNEIQNDTDTVESEMRQMIEASQRTSATVTEGNEVVRGLMKQTRNVEEASKITVEVVQSLTRKVDEVQSFVGTILEISSQTNLLALNASIEAARAGEAGKGFSVVAEEIRTLAEETKSLTKRMGTFVDAIQNASHKSSESVDTTVAELEHINENIQNVWKITGNNRQSMDRINDSVSSLAAFSEEISSSMNEMDNQMQYVSGECQCLHNNMDSLKISSRSISELVEPSKMIEKHLEESTKIMGRMVQDAFYMLDNHVLLNCMNSAIDAHRNWLNTLHEMAQSGTLKVLQTDCTKCGLGHFYYTFKPVNPQIATIWNELDGKHKTFHSYGTEMITAIRSGRSQDLQQIYEKAETCSRDLISDFQTIIQIIETLSKDNIRIFEKMPLNTKTSVNSGAQE